MEQEPPTTAQPRGATGPSSKDLVRRFRYAPTPSHDLHLGNGLAALIGWAYAQLAGGTFILRIEDIDQGRCRDAHAASCLEDLHWLGIDWDEGPGVGGPKGPYVQSERFQHYNDALSLLIDRETAFACTCSRADIRRAQGPDPTKTFGERPYPGTCREAGHEAESVDLRGGFRLALERLDVASEVRWVDRTRGPHAEDVRKTCGDFLLGRWSRPTYQLAVVVDDIAMGITDVVRGHDLIGSTARQILLHQALGHAAPDFCHHPLLIDPRGRKLSKRDKPPTIGDIRRSGVSASRVIARVFQAVGGLTGSVNNLRAQDVPHLLTEPGKWYDGTLPDFSTDL
jgi:glutamyl-tRNA synthetase